MVYQITIPTGKRLSLPAVLFFEDFESPVVVGYDQGTLPDANNWLGSNTGFGNDRKGLDEKSSGNWEDGVPGNLQSFNTQYTNSGICTDTGEVGTINLETVTYKFTLQVAYDKAVSGPHGSPSGDYDSVLFAVPGGFDRQDFTNFAGDFVPEALVRLQGTVPNDDGVHFVSGTYTTDPVTDAAWSGRDLAVALDGATSSANIVSAKVEIV